MNQTNRRVSIEGSVRVYVSGPMTGYPEFNYPEFNRVSDLLRSKGFDVVNPVDVCREVKSGEWCDFMRPNIKALVDCAEIVMLPGWTGSRGAKLEHHIAKELGMPIREALHEGWAT